MHIETQAADCSRHSVIFDFSLPVVAVFSLLGSVHGPTIQVTRVGSTEDGLRR